MPRYFQCKQTEIAQDYGCYHNSSEVIVLLGNTALFKSIKHKIDSKCHDLKSS